MFLSKITRGNARALFGAAATGSVVGLALAGAFLMGGTGSQAGQPSATELTPVAMATSAAPAPALVETVNRQGERSGELLKTSLRGPAAKPFRSDSRSDLDCLTEAVYYEARGEGRAGQAAVAQVVLNRVRHPSFPSSVCAVVYQGCQFSFACNGAMRARRESGAWNRAREVAERALAGAVAANVGNATHFHTIHVAPQWGPNLMRVGQVGLHVFYRFAGRNGRPSAFSDGPSGADSNEPGKHEYRRLTPEERVYMTSLTLAKPADVAKAGMGGPAGPVSEPASAPIQVIKPAPVQPSDAAAEPAPATTVKTAAPAPVKPSAPSAATASVSLPASAG